MDTDPINVEKDKHLWKIAKKRVEFRRHLATYFIINAFFWALWYFTDKREEERTEWPWPIYPMLGWGIGILFHFIGAYFPGGVSSVEKEYDKLKNKQS